MAEEEYEDDFDYDDDDEAPPPKYNMGLDIINRMSYHTWLLNIALENDDVNQQMKEIDVIITEISQNKRITEEDMEEILAKRKEIKAELKKLEMYNNNFRRNKAGKYCPPEEVKEMLFMYNIFIRRLVNKSGLGMPDGETEWDAVIS